MVSGIHRLLNRQIRKFLHNTDMGMPGLRDFINAVNEAYIGLDKDYKQLERTLELSSGESFKELSEFKFALDEAAIVAITDTKGIITYVNNKFCNISGYSREELIGQDYDILNSSYHPEKVNTSIWNTINAGKVFHGEIRNKAKSKKYYWVDITIVPIVSAGGQLNSFLSIQFDITDRKKTEQKLSETTILQQAILDSANHSIISTNVKGIIKTFNVGAEKLLGYLSSEVVNFHTPELFHNHEEIEARAAELSRELSMPIKPNVDVLFVKARLALVDEHEWNYTRKNGTTFPISLSVTEIKSQEGEVTGYLCIAKDITERKKNEEEILKREMNLQAIVRSLDDIVFEIDEDLTFLNVWTNNESSLFMPREHFISNRVKDVLAGPLGVKFETALLKVLQTGQGEIIEYNSGLPGDDRWFHAKMNLIQTSSGRKISTLIQDITEKKHADEMINLFMFNVEKSADPMYRLIPDKDFTFSYVNKAASEHFGYSQKELLNISICDCDINLSHDDYLEFWNKLKKEKFLFIETNHRRKNGSVVPVEMSANYIKYGDVEYITGYFRDITERKISEKTISNQNNELAKTNEELDKFVYSASHDLRAPLASVMGLLNIAKSSNDNPDQLKYLGMMEKSINKLDGFIMDIIYYSRNSRLKVSRNKINFKELINDSIENLKYIEGVDKVKIQVNIDNQIPFYSDESRLLVIFNNLISNAFKYHNLRQMEPYIAVHVTSGTEKTTFRVKDNGSGIREENVGKIFDMFYRASENSVGSGLGLYIVKETLTKLNGNIKVISEINVGTTFIVEVPNLLTTD